MTIAPLLKGLMVRDGDVKRTPYPPNLQVEWAKSQPSADGPIVTNDQLAAAANSGLPFRLRPMAGQYAPDWLKARVGTFIYIEPQSGAKVLDMPRWWRPGYISAYASWISKIAAQYDGQIKAAFVSGGMTYYAEPCQRGLQSSVTRTNLLAAGYTFASDDSALKASIDAHTVFTTTRMAFAFNPFQHLTSATNWTSDENYTDTLMTYMRGVAATSIIQNNSIRDAYIGQETRTNSLYHDMVVQGKPLGFQTAATKTAIGNLYNTIQWASSMGAHVVELPPQFETMLTAAQLTTLDAALKAN